MDDYSRPDDCFQYAKYEKPECVGVLKVIHKRANETEAVHGSRARSWSLASPFVCF